jgi:hypothetical protein
MSLADVQGNLPELYVNISFTARVRATACNALHDCTEALSNQVFVDVIDPTPGSLQDGLLLDFTSGGGATDWRSVQWDSVLLISCADTDGDFRDASGCAASNLLTSNMSLYAREIALRSLLPLVVAESGENATGNATQSVLILPAVNHLAASWSAFSDATSGIGRTELCFGTYPGGDDTVPCVLVPSSGVAVTTYVQLVDHTTYHATVRAYDRADRSSAVSSLGARYYGRKPEPYPGYVPASPTTSQLGGLLERVTVPSPYTANCDVFTAEWKPFVDPDCPTTIHNVSLCHPTLLGMKCTAPATVQPVTNADGSASVSFSSSGQLQPGVAHYLHAIAVGCSGLSSTLVAPAFVCDTSPPAMNGTVLPTLRLASLAFVTWLPPTGEVRISWPNVFVDPESPIEEFEVCLIAVPVNCTEWLSAGLQDSIVVTLNATNETSSVAAAVRARNLAGLVSDNAVSVPVPLDYAPPTLTRMSVDAIQSDGESPCVLNRTHSVYVDWNLNSAGGSSIYNVVVTLQDGSADGAILQTFTNPGGVPASMVLPVLNVASTLAVFTVTATDMAGWEATLSMLCHVHVLPPTVTSVYVSNGRASGLSRRSSSCYYCCYYCCCYRSYYYNCCCCCCCFCYVCYYYCYFCYSCSCYRYRYYYCCYYYCYLLLLLLLLL